MPTLPSYGEPRVRQAPLPGVEAPLEAFGGGRAAARTVQEGQAALGDVTLLLAEKVKKEQHDADAARMSQARRALNEKEYGLLYDPKTGAKSMLGAKAFGLQDSVPSEFDKFTSEYEKTLSTDEQKNAWRAMVESRRDHVVRSVLEHVHDQTTVAEMAELQAGTKSSIDRAAADPTTVPLESRIVEDNLRKLGEKQGWKQEKTAFELAGALSHLHSQVIDRMMARGNDLQAKAYYEKNQASLVGEDARRVAEAVYSNSSHALARRIASQVLSRTYQLVDQASGQVVNEGQYPYQAGPGQTTVETPGAATLNEAIARGRELTKDKDGKVQDLVDMYINRDLDFREKAEHDRQAALYEEYARAVDANPRQPVDTLMPLKWADLKTQFRDALQQRAVREVDDPSAWLEFVTLQGDPEKLAALGKADFESKYWSQFNVVHRAKAEAAWTSARESKANEKARARYQSILSDQKMVLRALGAVGAGGIRESDDFADLAKDGAKDKAMTFARFERMADDALLAAYHDNNDKPLGDDKKRKVIEDLVAKQSREYHVRRNALGQDWAWPDSKIPLWKMTEEDRAAAYVTDIPDDRRKEMSTYIESFGKKPTEEKLSRMRAARLMDRADLYEKAAKE